MARRDHLVRVLTLAHELQRSGARGVVLKPLAERHDWPLRALYRDVETLEAAGYPIVHERGRYRLHESFRGVAGVGVDAEELAALFLARQLAGSWRSTTLGKGLDRLWSKLAAGRDRQVPLVPDGPPWFAARTLVGIDYRQHAKTIAVFERAIRERRVVRCVYRGRRAAGPGGEGDVGARGARVVTQRDIEPGELYWDPGLESLYVLAYCRLRKDARVFAVHRFKAVEMSDERFTVRPGVSSRRMLRDAFRVWRGDAAGNVQRVRIRFTGGAAEYVKERQWHESQRVVEEGRGGKGGEGNGGKRGEGGEGKRGEGGEGGEGGEETVVLELELAAEEEVARWILGFGAEAEVLEPESLRTRVREEQWRSVNGRGGAGSLASGRPLQRSPKRA